ncbi:MAG: DUF3562 domain-containing protein [Pseudomonadota bacterium]|nr:DUF3562 domain-containing protein [Pseudomonadota bacterium]
MSTTADTQRGASAQREAGERRRLLREIEAIARDLQRPADEIAAVYAALYAELRARARVVDFLLVLVARKIRARYRARGAS